jgi:hypothetical protein
LLAGGKKPYRAFVVGLGIIVIGASVFDPRYLKEKEQADWHLSFYPWHPSFLLELWEYLKNHNFSQFRTGIINRGKLVILRFLISLDQFVPAINLKLAAATTIFQDLVLVKVSINLGLDLNPHRSCGHRLPIKMRFYMRKPDTKLRSNK